ncbi:MAG: hypothetical protein AMJ54_14485 [Deltaproteobacteria bacterium SG8_13]|nr:MAG: hypothetical protein AMJ54_14485 [Deltaproteobacteria bacterium SG8_13]
MKIDDGTDGDRPAGSAADVGARSGNPGSRSANAGNQPDSPFTGSVKAGENRMLLPPEKRISERCSCGGSIRFGLFNREQTHGACVTDFSEQGLGIQSKLELKRGLYLLIRLDGIRPGKPDVFRKANLRSIGIAEVKWCRSVEDGSDTAFAAGIKFLLPGYSV